MKPIRLVVPIFFIFLTQGNCLAKSDNFIHIGFFGIFTGTAKVYGRVALNSAKLAIEEINKKGIHGKKLKLHVRDTKSDPAVALTVAKQLVKKKVDLFVGFHTSDERLAVKSYIETHKKVYLYSAIYEGRDSGKYTFFSGPIPNQIYGASIPHIIKKHNIKTVYLVGSDYSYAQVSHQYLRKMLRRYNIKIVGEKLYPFPATSFDISDIVTKKPDLIISNIVGEDDLLWTIKIQENEEIMNKVKVFSGLQQDPILNAVSKKYRQNFYSASPFSKLSKNKKSKSFTKLYKARFGNEFGSVGQGAYDSLLLLADALRRSNTDVTPEVLSKAFIGARAKGPRGKNIMNKNHHVTMDIYLVRGDKDKEYKILKHFKNVPPVPKL